MIENITSIFSIQIYITDDFFEIIIFEIEKKNDKRKLHLSPEIESADCWFVYKQYLANMCVFRGEIGNCYL